MVKMRKQFLRIGGRLDFSVYLWSVEEKYFVSITVYQHDGQSLMKQVLFMVQHIVGFRNVSKC